MTARRVDWRELVKRWQASGQSIRQWCDEHGVARSSLRDWARCAGIETQQPPHPRRQVFEEALQAGLTPWKASIAAGVRYWTAKRWVA